MRKNTALLYGIGLLLKHSGGNLQGVSLPFDLGLSLDYKEISDPVKSFCINIIRGDGFTFSMRFSDNLGTTNFTSLGVPIVGTKFSKEHNLYWGLNDMPINIVKEILSFDSEESRQDDSRYEFSWSLDKDVLEIYVINGKRKIMITVEINTSKIDISKEDTEDEDYLDSRINYFF